MKKTIEDSFILVAAVSIVVFLVLCLMALVELKMTFHGAYLATIEKDHIIVQGMRQESLDLCIQKADALNNEVHTFRWVCAVVPGRS